LSRLLLINGWLPRAVQSHRVDLLFVPFQIAVIASTVPQVVVMHDLRALRLPETSSLLGRVFLQRIFRPSVRQAKRVIAVSESTKRDLVQLWRIPEERIDVVYEGFDSATFRPYERERIEATQARHDLARPYVSYVGTFARHKNLKLALQVLASARRKLPQLEFVVAGRRDAGDYAEFIDHARELQLEGYVRVLGYVDTADLGPLLAGASAFLLPSLYEGFGLSALEAMACGTPVLASNLASLPEVVGSGGYLLDPQDPDAWAETVVRLVAGEIDSKETRSRALRQAARVDWERTVERIVDIISQIAGNERSELGS
jgi:glycosyltransferase involved in cell wall biosynthesis